MTRGLRNHNPLNIRKSGDRFKGEVVPSSDAAFKQFESDAYGYRAAFVILSSYLKCGKNNIVKIVASWAPSADGNNTASYIANVEKRSGVDRFQPLTIYSGRDYISIVAAMSQSENGVPAVMEDVEAGFALQNRLRK